MRRAICTASNRLPPAMPTTLRSSCAPTSYNSRGRIALQNIAQLAHEPVALLPQGKVARVFQDAHFDPRRRREGAFAMGAAVMLADENDYGNARRDLGRLGFPFVHHVDRVEQGPQASLCDV